MLRQDVLDVCLMEDCDLQPLPEPVDDCDAVCTDQAHAEFDACIATGGTEEECLNSKDLTFALCLAEQCQ